MSKHHHHPRRKILQIGAGALAGLALPRFAAGQELSPTPQCEGNSAVTSAQTEGPFFKPKSPLLSDLRQSGLTGDTVTLTGFVLTRSCQPVANALVDLWHADAKGDYDNRGFRGRGHQFTDAQGRYRFVTILPGPLYRPHPPLSCEGAGGERAGADDAALFSGRAGQCPRSAVPARIADGGLGRRVRPRGALRFRDRARVKYLDFPVDRLGSRLAPCRRQGMRVRHPIGMPEAGSGQGESMPGSASHDDRSPEAFSGLLGPVSPRCARARLAACGGGPVRVDRVRDARRAGAGCDRGARTECAADRDGLRREL